MKFNGIDFDTYFNNYPDKNGYFGKYGGVYIDDKLKAAMAEITEAYYSICQSRKFIAELRRIRKEFQGRPTPITHLERLSDSLGGKVQLYAKREDLNHSGAHKLNHCMGEALLAKYMGKKKVIAEQAQVSMVSLLQLLQHILACNAIFIWALLILKSKLQM